MPADRGAGPKRKPRWLKVPAPWGKGTARVRRILDRCRLSTVCTQARCPNIGECYGRGTATFLIMGRTCTRSCSFCNIGDGLPAPLEADEPARVAEAAREMGLKFVVITSVTRDDLSDGGAAHFAATIRAVKAALPEVGVEVLIPDLQGSVEALETILEAEPTVLNHNLETVPRLYARIRGMADYERSLQLLADAAARGAQTKSGLMLGLGETLDEVRECLADLARVGCCRLTLGQYLPPSSDHAPLERYVTPEEFGMLRHVAIEMGFVHVEAAPLVRSSYHAEDQGKKRED